MNMEDGLDVIGDGNHADLPRADGEPLRDMRMLQYRSRRLASMKGGKFRKALARRWAMERVIAGRHIRSAGMRAVAPWRRPMRRLCLAALGAVALAACGTLPRPVGTEPVGDAYSAGGGKFDDGASVIMLIRAFEQDGRVAYCGVRTVQGPTGRTAFLGDLVPGAAVLYLAGDRIHQGLAGLPEARFRRDMTGATARCFVTDHAWRPDYDGAEPVLRIARMQFDQDEEGGDVVVFRQQPVARPLPGPPPDQGR